MRKILKSALGRVWPDGLVAIQAVRGRRLIHRQAERSGLAALARNLAADCGPIVQSGPFKGMVLPAPAFAQNLGPKLLGTYEQELHPEVVFLKEQPITTVIDIGASIGYYAVGLARLFPQANVIAFEADRWSRRVIIEAAKLNGVKNIAVRRVCTVSELRKALPASGALVICDCEGGEATLLDPSQIPKLAQSHLVVEVHDHVVPGITDAIIDRFRTTHSIRVIDYEPSSRRKVIPLLGSASHPLFDEGRPLSSRWLSLRALT